MAVDKLLPQREVALQFQSPSGAIRRQAWTAPAAANATLYTSAASLASGGTLTSFSAQPAFARNVQIVASGAATGNVVFTGTDIRGQVITETLALNGATPVLGVKAFKTVTSVVLPTVAATTINIGTGVKLGLDRNMLEASVIDAYADGVRETTAATVAFSGTVATASISSNTVSFNTAPNGTHNYAVYFATTDVTEASGTTA
jgi:hypothetical protein